MSLPRPSKIKAINLFRAAEQGVLAAGFDWEIAWQRDRDVTALSERDLLRESAWVILCSGFREATVRKLFDYISLCFCDWESAAEITRNRAACVATASAKFCNGRKLGAIASIAEVIAESGFEPLRRRIQDDPIHQLQRLPFIGPVTSWHLAKNLGLDVAKNDRHLARLAEELGYSDANTLCGDIAEATGERVAVVDLVLWRFAVLSRRFTLAQN